MWWLLVSSAEESGKGKTTCWRSQNDSLYKRWVDLGKVILFSRCLWKEEGIVHHLFSKVNFYVSNSYQVSLKTLRLRWRLVAIVLLWRRSRVHEYCAEFYMREKRLLLIGRGMCLTLFCQYVVYQFQRSICGSIIHKGMIFWMSTVLSYIIFLLNKPYLSLNLSNGGK